MLNLLAISNYRSLSNLIVPLGALNLITGPNGSGKSNVYRALRLLADTANGGVVGSLAREGGISSTLWAGPATQRKEPVALRRAGADGRLTVGLRQEGLLRPLNVAELSDGTLRYLLWCAALLTPRPPQLMVLNEPESSLHPDPLPGLARLIGVAAKQTQVWVVSHASRLIAALKENEQCQSIDLEKDGRNGGNRARSAGSAGVEMAWKIDRRHRSSSSGTRVLRSPLALAIFARGVARIGE